MAVRVVATLFDDNGLPVAGASVAAVSQEMAARVTGVSDRLGRCVMPLFAGQWRISAFAGDMEGFEVSFTVPDKDGYTIRLEDLVEVPRLSGGTGTGTESGGPGHVEEPDVPGEKPADRWVSELSETGNSAIFRIRAALLAAVDRINEVRPDMVRQLEALFDQRVAELRQEVLDISAEALASAESARQSVVEAQESVAEARQSVVEAQQTLDELQGVAEQAQQSADEAAGTVRVLQEAVQDTVEAVNASAAAARQSATQAALSSQGALAATDQAMAAREQAEEVLRAVRELVAQMAERKPPYRSEWTQVGGLEAGGLVTVPEYEMGTGKLFLYRDGKLLQPGLDYIEVDATTVSISAAVAETTAWCAVVVPDMAFASNIRTLAMYLFNGEDPFMYFDPEGSVDPDIPENLVFVVG